MEQVNFSVGIRDKPDGTGGRYMAEPARIGQKTGVEAAKILAIAYE